MKIEKPILAKMPKKNAGQETSSAVNPKREINPATSDSNNADVCNKVSISIDKMTKDDINETYIDQPHDEDHAGIILTQFLLSNPND